LDDDSRKLNNSEVDDSILGGVDVNIFKYDIKVIFITLRKRIIFLILIPVLTASLALCYVVFYKKKVWVARCMMFRHTNLDQVQGGDMPTIYKPVDTKVIIEMIRSRQNMRNVIQRLKLNTSVDSLYSQTEVQMDDENQNIISILAGSRSPQEAADIANTLAEVFVDEYVKTQNNSVEKIYEMYLRSKELTQQKVSELEKEEQEYLKKSNVISITTETDGKFKQLNELEINLLQAKLLLSSLEIKLENVNKNMKGLKKEVPLNYTVSSPDSSAIEDMKTQLYKLQQRYTDENPRVQKLQSEIVYMQKQMEARKNNAPVPSQITYGDNQSWVLLEDSRIKTISEIEGSKQNISQLEVAIAQLKGQLGTLSQLGNNYYDINRKLQLNWDVLKKIDNMIMMLKFTLKSSVSDISIWERAEPPPTPSVKRRRITIVIGGLAGFFLALGVIVLSELVDFTVKSRFDLENILRIKVLGILPKIEHVNLQTFYSAIQVIYKRILEMTSEKDSPILVAFGDVESKSGKTFFIKKCIDVFNPQDKKILYISTGDDISKNLDKFVINDYIYKDEVIDSELAVENNNRLYFMLDDYTYIAPADKFMIEKFVNKFKGTYDFVFWELFDFTKNEQLFATICESSALTVVMTRFRKSNKFGLMKCINFLKEHNCVNIGGILNCVDKK